MNHVLLFLLFLVLYSAQGLNLNLSLAPGLSVKNAFLYLIFVSLAVQIAVTQQRRLELPSVLGPFALYVLYAACMWAAVLWVMQYPGYGFRQTVIPLKNGPVENFLILLVFFYGLASVKQALWVLRSAMWVVIAGNVLTVLDASGIASFGLIDYREDGRVGGPVGSSNEFANFLAFCLPIIAALYWTETGLKKILAGAGLLVSGLAFLMAASRGGVIGLLGGVAFGVLFLRKALPAGLVIRTSFIVVIVCTLVLVGVFGAGYGGLLLDRLAEFEANPDTASSGRTVIWSRLLAMMLEYPISFVTGFGWWSYQTYLAVGYFRLSPHSTYLDILFNLGAIGLTLFLLICVNVLRTVRAAASRSNSETRAFLFAFVIGFLALLVAILFNELHGVWLYVWATVGISLRIASSEMAGEHEPVIPRRYRPRTHHATQTMPLSGS